MKTVEIVIIDYDVGNIRSIKRAIQSAVIDESTQLNVCVTSEIDRIITADAIVLPGVGSYKQATLSLAPIRDDLTALVSAGKPILGICLGMQLLFESSTEGDGDGLGIFKGKVTKLNSQTTPHMGWNTIENSNSENKELQWAYFAHSYVCQPEDISIVSGYSTFQGVKFVSMVESNNILGTQFHPEKSDLEGISLVHRFIGKVLS